jgi:hypothetical protein
MAIDTARSPFTTIEPVLDEVHGIWDESDIFTKYRVSLTFTGRLMGGVPQKPEAIEGWIRQRIQGGDAEVFQLMRQTLEDEEIDTTGLTSIEQLHEAARRFAAEQHGNCFRRDANGLFISDYQVKAAIKENTNILYAGDRWGKTKKGPRSFVAERVFVDEPRVYLGRTEPDGIHLQVGHVVGPRGPRSTLTYYDYVEMASIEFTVSSLRDEVEAEHWKMIFLAAQRNGLGALRSLGYGQFKITGFDRQ